VAETHRADVKTWAYLLFENIKTDTMKHLMKYRFFQTALTVIFLTLTQAILAQDNSSSSSTTTHTVTTTTTWFVPIWAWVLGGVVLLIIIIALVSRGGRTDKVIIKEKSERV
jgi:hypothetical protein